VGTWSVVDEQFELLGRKTHTLYSEADGFAPDALSNQNNVVKGGHETGNVLFEVRESDISARHLLLYVDSNVSFDAALNNDRDQYRVVLEKFAENAIVDRHESNGQLFNAFFESPDSAKP
jgi:hypothetical protein